MCNWVVNQDRDKILSCSSEVMLYILPVFFQKNCIAFNLNLEDDLLGTFDTIEEAMININNILNCKSKIYMVSGYCL